MEYIRIDAGKRESANSFIKDRWGTTKMIIRGEAIDLTEVEGIMAVENDEIVGLITYYIKDSICEITSLDSLLEGKGIGSGLVSGVVEEAKTKECKKVIVETTNDNINALHFYQKRGFDMTRLRHNSLDEARKIKPDIPLTGRNGIPLKHNIEFEMCLE